MAHWVIDGNNLLGARADGWWKDRAGASRRLAEELDRWAAEAAETVTIVFDGHRPEPWPDTAVDVRFAESSARDAADDVIAELVGDLHAGEPGLTVVTSDRGLAARLPPGVGRIGSGRFLQRLG